MPTVVQPHPYLGLSSTNGRFAIKTRFICELMLCVIPKRALAVNQCYPKINFTTNGQTAEMRFSLNGQIRGHTRFNRESMLCVIPKHALDMNQCYPKMNFTPNGQILGQNAL